MLQVIVVHLMQKARREQGRQLRLDVVERGTVGARAGELAADLAVFGDDGLQQARQFLGGKQHAGFASPRACWNWASLCGRPCCRKLRMMAALASCSASGADLAE